MKIRKKRTINVLTLSILLMLFLGCKDSHESVNSSEKKLTIDSVASIDSIRAELLKPNGTKVLVVAHRGDWRNAPENSLQAIENCIEMGVDMVEIDVRKTKDNRLVVIHDRTIDRTTNGSGLVKNWTLDSLKTLFLKNGLGRLSNQKIPTLEEAMLEAKGKIMINLDKCYDYFPEAYKILEETETTDHVVIKGAKAVDEVTKDFGEYLDKVIFMPIIHLDKSGYADVIKDYQEKMNPVAMELVFSSDTLQILSNLSKLKERGSRVWINSLWSTLNGGHDDNLAVDSVEDSYGWILDKGANIIQTDRPALLLEYLRNKGLHN